MADDEIRNRVKELRYVRAGDLIRNERNWRTHPEQQHNAMRAVLQEIRFAGAALGRETDQGVVLIDRHLRQEDVPEDFEVPVLILDVDENEANKILATYDPLSAMAGSNEQALNELIRDVAVTNETIVELLASLASADCDASSNDAGVDVIPEQWGVFIAVDDEESQVALITEMQERGLSCRALM